MNKRVSLIDVIANQGWCEPEDVNYTEPHLGDDFMNHSSEIRVIGVIIKGFYFIEQLEWYRVNTSLA